MCLRRAPEKYIAGAALDRAAVDHYMGHISGALSYRSILLALNNTRLGFFLRIRETLK
jgi:hypothetical protein